MNCIGIDIGKSGHIVVIHEDSMIYKYPIPLQGSEVDVNELTIILRTFKDDSIAYMEDLHSIYGVSASSNYSFGWINGLFEGILTTLSIPYVKVQAKKWQKEMFEGIPMQFALKKGKQKVDTKAMSIMASKRLFPTFDLRISDKGRVDNHNVSDALLLAAYGRKNSKL